MALEMDLPLVSILTPVYNHARFVGACIESILSQTYPNWELLIIDDGSTDNTRAIAKNCQDSRVHYFSQENQGIERLAHTYNRALSEARGEIVAILEGDDLWPPNKLSSMVPVFRDSHVVLAHGNVVDIDYQGVSAKRLPRIYKEKAKLPHSILFNDPVGSSTAYLLSSKGQCFLPPATVLLRHSTLASIGGFQYIPGQCSPDIPTFVRMSVQGKFFYVPQVMGFRRRHMGSATIRHLATMPRAAQNYVLAACKDPALHLSAEDQRMIESEWRNVLDRSEFVQGRLSLINRQWIKARQQFARSLHSLDPRIMVGASLGWLVSWFHFDLEGVYRLAGRASLRRDET